MQLRSANVTPYSLFHIYNITVELASNDTVQMAGNSVSNWMYTYLDVVTKLAVK